MYIYMNLIFGLVWFGFHFVKVISKRKIEYLIQFDSVLANSIRFQFSGFVGRIQNSRPAQQQMAKQPAQIS